ncbi:acyltransferase domain-containing protein [Chitinophaga varians]|uniref:acyltransferase domain-containing protein n=1 Tax=Chitinophaga varians TaxID=2202339 RepID=UPI00165F6DBD|nr:acyltransferase domain-containing protein [Chitinophaga varians]MBC9915298.1 acyltransferase domain-containing protein [Chitinophaga varians]
MNKRIIFMFGGQGTQYYHMGRELYEKHARFRYWMDHCDTIAAPLLQTSLTAILYRGKGKGEPFDNLLHTNPALLCFQYSLYQVLREMDIRPDLLLGYSMGEAVAAVSAGAVSLEDGIRLMIAIARLAEQTPKAEMMAILAPKMIMADYPELFSQCWLAGTNFQNNFVVSGLPAAMQALRAALNQMNIISQQLPVCRGFHTPLIDPVGEACRQLVREVPMIPGSIPLISSLTATVLKELHPAHFWEAIRYPVSFENTVVNTLTAGEAVFIDLSASGSLATLVKYILPADSGAMSIPVVNQFGRDIMGLEKMQHTLAGLHNMPGVYQ